MGILWPYYMHIKIFQISIVRACSVELSSVARPLWAQGPLGPGPVLAQGALGPERVWAQGPLGPGPVWAQGPLEAGPMACLAQGPNSSNFVGKPEGRYFWVAHGPMDSCAHGPWGAHGSWALYMAHGPFI